MNSNDFLKRVFKTGVATDEEIAKFMIRNYALIGYNFEDFEMDLIMKYNKSEEYSKALYESFIENLKKWSK